MFVSMGTAVGELPNMWNDMPGKNALFPQDFMNHFSSYLSFNLKRNLKVKNKTKNHPRWVFPEEGCCWWNISYYLGYKT